MMADPLPLNKASVRENSRLGSTDAEITRLGHNESEVLQPSCCCQEAGIRHVNLSYVGNGNGTFEQVTSYNYVGHGRGSYEREEVVRPGGWNMMKVGICISSSVLGAIILVILCHFWLGFVRDALAGAWNPIFGPIFGGNYDCNDGLDNWAAGWDEGKKQWCCRMHQKGCPPPNRGCDTTCNYRRMDASCRGRIQWGAKHQFKNLPEACAKSYQMVMSQCPYCHGCDFAAARCED